MKKLTISLLLLCLLPLFASAQCNKWMNMSVGALSIPYCAGWSSAGGTIHVDPSCDGTTDKLSVIQAAITAYPDVYFTAQTAACIINAPLRIPSNRTIRNAWIKAANGSMTSGGVGLASNSDFTGGNTNIWIDGGTWDGNNANQTRYADGPGGLYTGVGFRFKNVTNLRMTNLTITNPLTFGVQCGNCTNATFEDITLSYTNPLNNMDGIHINGPATQVLIRNLVGVPNDDMVCLCANDGTAAEFTHGNITSALIDGIRGGYRGVKFLADEDNITNVTVRHITGSYSLDAVQFTNVDAATGTVSGIVLEDVKPTTSRNTVRYERAVAGITLRDIDTTGGSIAIIGGVSVTYSTANRSGPLTVHTEGGVLNVSNPTFSSGAVVYGLSIDYLGRFFWGYQNTSHVFRADSGTIGTMDATGLTLTGGLTAAPGGTIPAWKKYSLVAIANGVNGCANANGCWQVNGVLGANKAAGLTQDVTLFALPAKGHVTDWRIKTATVCTGATTANTGFGTTGNTTLFRAKTYNIAAAVSDTNLSNGPTAGSGVDTAAATNIVASLVTTVANIDQLATGCAVDYSVLWAVLP